MLFNKNKIVKENKTPKAQVLFHVDADQLAALDKLAGPRGRSELLRRIVDYYVTEKSELPSVREQAMRSCFRYLTAPARERLAALARETRRSEIDVLEHLLNFVDTTENLETARAADVVLQGLVTHMQAEITKTQTRADEAEQELLSQARRADEAEQKLLDLQDKINEAVAAVTKLQGQHDTSKS